MKEELAELIGSVIVGILIYPEVKKEYEKLM